MATVYERFQLGVPPGGAAGQILSRTADGWAWVDAPAGSGGVSLPAGADGQVLTWMGSAWQPADPQTTSEVSSTSITDATGVGRSLLTAETQAGARSAIKAGTVSTVNGVAPDSAGNVTIVTGAGSVASSGITDSTSVGRSVLTAADAAAARTAIGAGTSSLALGTTSSTAKAGNYQPTAANITDATTTGRAIVKAPAGTSGQVLSTNGDGTVAWTAAPTGGGAPGTASNPLVNPANPDTLPDGTYYITY